jgi:hypothetical protein
LLFDHDCVIVPSLGGFLASNRSANLSLQTNVIQPPFRKIAFNVYLKQNDGLLANHLVSYENITYTNAVKKIEEFVNNCREEMSSGKKIYIHDVGQLFYDKEKNVQFEAAKNSNHLRDSFGFEPVHFIPIQREVSKVLKNNSRPSIPPLRKLPVRISKGLILISAAIVWFAFNLYILVPKNYNASSLNPFEAQPAKTEIKKADNKSLQTEPAKIETVYVASVNPLSPSEEKEIPEELKVTESPEIRNDNPAFDLPSSGSDRHFFVVAGVFRIHENAENLLHELKEQGFANARIIKANRRSYVAYDGFDTKGLAASAADNLGKKDFPGWVWSN